MNNANTNKVTPITDKQSAPSCRFTIQATLRGFPITIEGEGRAGDLKVIVDRLFDLGAEPPVIAPASTTAQPETTKKAPPVCPDHGAPMKASRKPGSFFCPRQTDGGGYCPHKA